MTLTGEGFSTNEMNSVTVGNAACVEESATDTEVRMVSDLFCMNTYIFLKLDFVNVLCSGLIHVGLHHKKGMKCPFG